VAPLLVCGGQAGLQLFTVAAPTKTKKRLT